MLDLEMETGLGWCCYLVRDARKRLTRACGGVVQSNAFLGATRMTFYKHDQHMGYTLVKDDTVTIASFFLGSLEDSHQDITANCMLIVVVHLLPFPSPSI